MKSFNERVYDIVKKIPKGYVLNYGRVARLAGNPRGARAVGYALHAVPDPVRIPWHRVVFKDGSLFPDSDMEIRNRQYELLMSEGVYFVAGPRVDMDRCSWSAIELEFGL